MEKQYYILEERDYAKYGSSVKVTYIPRPPDPPVREWKGKPKRAISRAERIASLPEAEKRRAIQAENAYKEIERQSAAATIAWHQQATKTGVSSTAQQIKGGTVQFYQGAMLDVYFVSGDSTIYINLENAFRAYGLKPQSNKEGERIGGKVEINSSVEIRYYAQGNKTEIEIAVKSNTPGMANRDIIRETTALYYYGGYNSKNMLIDFDYFQTLMACEYVGREKSFVFSGAVKRHLAMKEYAKVELLSQKEASQIGGGRRIVVLLDLNSGKSFNIYWAPPAVSYHTDWSPATVADTNVIKSILDPSALPTDSKWSSTSSWSFDARSGIIIVGERRIAVGFHLRPHASDFSGGKSGLPSDIDTPPQDRNPALSSWPLGGHMCMYYGESPTGNGDPKYAKNMNDAAKEAYNRFQ